MVAIWGWFSHGLSGEIGEEYLEIDFRRVMVQFMFFFGKPQTQNQIYLDFRAIQSCVWNSHHQKSWTTKLTDPMLRLLGCIHGRWPIPDYRYSQWILLQSLENHPWKLGYLETTLLTITSYRRWSKPWHLSEHPIRWMVVNLTTFCYWPILHP